MSSNNTPEQEILPPDSFDKGFCPPHHWMIVERREDGFKEERWECRRCGDAKLTRTAIWAGGPRRMANTSTWTPEDRILGGDEDEALLENEAGA